MKWQGEEIKLCLGILPDHPIPISVYRGKSYRYQEAMQR
jgi:hypothetical protein